MGEIYESFACSDDSLAPGDIDRPGYQRVEQKVDPER